MGLFSPSRLSFRRIRAAGFFALAAAPGWLLPAPVAAQTISQLTDQLDPACFATRPAGDGQGRNVVFESTCDLVGTNADGNRELFRLGPIGLEQITDTLACANANPSVSADGTRIAYDSDCDTIGTNGDGSVEIFLIDQTTGISQLTAQEFCDSLAPSINAAGNVIAYDSDCNPLGTNLDRSPEIFQVDDAGATVQLTDDATVSGCGSLNASSNALGDLIAFESDCDFTGENFDGVSEIFNVTAGGEISQLTAAGKDDCGSGSASSDADGTSVAFESDCDYAGTNADAGLEIFVVDATGLEVFQLSDDAGVSFCESVAPSLAADGVDLWYSSTCDPVGDNSDGNSEIFRVEASMIEQITDASDCDSFSPALAVEAGQRGFFASNCDEVGMNADGSTEIFEASFCVCGGPVSRANPPVASDALFALNAAIGVTQCALCDCDVDNSGKVSATDALIILNASIGLQVGLDCP
jgi:Tol biopolymer transport system component